MTQQATRKRGRPVLGNDKLLQVKISHSEFADLERLALLRRTTLSEVVRQQLRQLIASASQTGGGSNQAVA